MRRAMMAMALVSMWLMLPGCRKTNLARDEVVAMAREKAKQEGFDLAKYDLQGCHYELTEKDHTWTVFFNQKPPTPPGGHFMVCIDDHTREVTLIRGE